MRLLEVIRTARQIIAQLEAGEVSPPSRRYEVNISYPNFDQQGRPYFDQTSINETLSMTADELKAHKLKEQQGLLKINDVRSDIPNAR